MAYQPVQPEQPQLVLFPHEQYKRRHSYEVASAIARKKRRSKLNDHRRFSLQHSTTQSMTTIVEERSDTTTTVRIHRHYSNDEDDTDDAIEESSLPSIVALGRSPVRSSIKKSLIRPDPIGIRTAVALVRQGHPLAMPTECTYELVLHTSLVPAKHDAFSTSEATHSRQHQQPHIYVPADAKVLEKSRLWTKRYTPVKSYGILNKDGSKTIASFNEAVVVLQAISPCIWPGPCCVYFPVARPVVFAYRIRASCPIVLLPNTSATANGSQQEQLAQAQHYVKLRSPRHPLAIRMCHELGYNTSRSRALSSSTTALNNSGTAASTNQEDHNSTNSSKLRTRSNVSAASSGNSSRDDDCGGGSSSSSLNKYRLLVGYPLTQQPTGAPVIESGQVPLSSMHALDGEDKTYEVLRVPTCKEFVCCGSCWVVLDVHRRTIYMAKELAQKPLQHALHHGSVHAPSAAAMLVQAAVLRKWKLEYRDEPVLWST